MKRLSVRTGHRAEVVVLLHGMLATRRSMAGLAATLSDQGYAVLNWGYPSLTHSIVNHAQRLSELLFELDQDDRFSCVHFVTHSMGGIILRYAVNRRSTRKCSRLVMLAPPNRGSRLANFPLGPLHGWFPQIAELSEAADSLVNSIPEPIGFEVGIIAASDDFVVDIGSTGLACQRDHVVVTSSHQRLPRRSETMRYVSRFLAHGRFDLAPKQPQPLARVPLAA